MQNLIQKFRQNSISFEKPGIVWKFGNFDEFKLPYRTKYFAEISQTFPAYQCLEKCVRDFFYFVYIFCLNLIIDL